LLATRHKIKTNDYVFPGAGVGGHIVEPRKQMNRVIEETKIPFTCHDLRRTFITDVERLRKPMQQVTDYLLKCENSTQNKG
jgi:integrase